MVEIPVGNTVALVDDDDAPALRHHTWCVNSDGSATTTGSVAMHRLIMRPPDGFDVWHRDGNQLNNQRSNLVIVPRSVTTHRGRRRARRVNATVSARDF